MPFSVQPEKHDGLAWQNADGSWEGPVGEAGAKALAEGYEEKKPFHGYYFKLLRGPGPAARLRTLDYFVEGAMIGGFAHRCVARGLPGHRRLDVRRQLRRCCLAEGSGAEHIEDRFDDGTL